jgi:hypothetical protein
VSSYVRWYWPDDDLWNYDELGADRWATRHIEVRGTVIVAAASLAEVLAARDTGSIDAVREYETRYGVVPEAPFPELSDDYPLEPVSAEEFEILWQTGRRTLEG